MSGSRPGQSSPSDFRATSGRVEPASDLGRPASFVRPGGQHRKGKSHRSRIDSLSKERTSDLEPALKPSATRLIEQTFETQAAPDEQ